MNQTPLSQALGPHLADGPNQLKSSIRGNHQGNPEPSPHHIPEQISPILIRLLIAQHQMKQDSKPLTGNPPSHQDVFLRPPIKSHRLINRIQKEVDHLKPAQIPLQKFLYSFQRASVISLTTLRDKSLSPCASLNRSSISRVESPQAYIS
jgi:hypothetical protein